MCVCVCVCVTFTFHNVLNSRLFAFPRTEVLPEKIYVVIKGYNILASM